MSETEPTNESTEETETRTDNPGTIKVFPSKDTYEAVGADVDASTSAGELVDNAIDNAGLVSGYTDPITVEFEHRTLDDGTDELVVRDDSGGIKPDELGVLMGLGQTKKGGAENRQVGAFGIGAKKALKALGDEYVISSRHYRAEQGYQYRVPKEWFEDDEAWTFELEETELPTGVTEIRIRELNIDWESQVDGIKSWLADTYQLYLGVGPSDVKLDLTLEVDGTTIDSPEPVDWSLSPWDGLYARQHHGFSFDSRELDAPVEMQVTVGVMREGSGDEAGTDIFCQDRLVEKANRDKEGGFGAPDGLPQFSLHSHRRFKMQVEFWTTEGGTAKDLPWNSDKSRISPTHPIMMQAYEWMRKVGKRYMTASQYGASGVDEAFLKPYGRDSEHARDGGIEVIDFSTRWERKLEGGTVRVTDKPEKGFPTVKKMEETAEAHARLGVYCDRTGWFEDWMIPAYEELVNEVFSEIDTGLETLTTISASPPDFTGEGWDVEEEIGRLTDLAQTHAEDGIYYTGLSDWEVPRYEAALEDTLEEGLTLDDLEEVDTMPDSSDLPSPDDEEDEMEGDDELEVDETEGGDPQDEDANEDEDELNELGEASIDDYPSDGTVDVDTEEDAQSVDAEDLSVSGEDLSVSGESEVSGESQHAEDGSLSLRFDGWDEERLEMVEKHFEDVEELSPEKRTELLVGLAKAIEDGRLKFSI